MLLISGARLTARAIRGPSELTRVHSGHLRPEVSCPLWFQPPARAELQRKRRMRLAQSAGVTMVSRRPAEAETPDSRRPGSQ
jgi:hypothetical protein